MFKVRSNDLFNGLIRHADRVVYIRQTSLLSDELPKNKKNSGTKTAIFKTDELNQLSDRQLATATKKHHK